MKKYVVTILAALALLALPLAAQVPEENEPLPERIEEEAIETQQEIEQEVDEAAEEVEEFGEEVEQEVDEAFDSEDPTMSDDELPATASPLAALALLGLAGAGSALGLRITRRK